MLAVGQEIPLGREVPIALLLEQRQVTVLNTEREARHRRCIRAAVLAHVLVFQVYQENTAVAFALLTTPHYRSSNEFADQLNLLRTVIP